MPRKELTDEQIAEFRLRAIQAAKALFAREGLKGVSMRKVAQALGCSPMTAYRYYADHGELIADLRTEAFRKFADEQQQTFVRYQTAREKIVSLVRNYVEFALREPDAYRLMFFVEPTQANYEATALRRESSRAFSYLLHSVEDGFSDGLFVGDSLTKATLLWAQLHGLVALYLAGKLIFGKDLLELLDALLADLGKDLLAEV
jgi:AcrR family transcriptional regulator